MPFISIFIPAYKNVDYLKRLLDSIVQQNYKDFELIITDDSPNDDVRLVIDCYLSSFTHCRYFKNNPALGMPQNWNYGLSLCKGEWIKIMHDDDWFVDSNSLQGFASSAISASNSFLFSAYYDVTDGEMSTKVLKKCSQFRRNQLTKEPLTLLSDNIIGPPSVTLVKNRTGVMYDNRLRWRVDIDYYTHLLNNGTGLTYIDKPLVYVGLSSNQVTKEVKNNKSVEIPEANILLNKYGTKSFHNILVYDSWWRLFRNLNIFDLASLNKYIPSVTWPIAIEKLLNDLGKYKNIAKASGILSKIGMLFSYFKNKSRIDA